jgi:predicted metal-binding protein
MRQIVMCTTCRHSPEARTGPDGRTGGETLIAHMREAIATRDLDVELETQACLWNCQRPCSVVLRDDRRFSYVTGGHEPSRAQAEAILDWFAAHGASSSGEVPFREWPQRMRGHFIARLPPVRP